MLTALGVGGLALGLALQDTLGNLFAGLGLLLDRALIVGDHVKLDGGYAGKIIDIGWRSTKLETPTGDLLVVPNTKLAQNIATRGKRGPHE
jgi:small-conductance mechanosensitive channel